MAETKIPKVPKDQFEAVMRNLLNASPKPMAEIPRKRATKVKLATAKKRR